MSIGENQDGEHSFFKASSWKILVNIKKLFMFQQSCLWTTFYQMDFMKKANNMFGQSRLDVQFVKNISLEMAIGQQMIEEGHDQNY